MNEGMSTKYQDNTSSTTNCYESKPETQAQAYQPLNCYQQNRHHYDLHNFYLYFGDLVGTGARLLNSCDCFRYFRRMRYSRYRISRIVNCSCSVGYFRCWRLVRFEFRVCLQSRHRLYHEYLPDEHANKMLMQVYCS